MHHELKQALRQVVEAYKYGQFSNDFDYPLAKPIRAAIRTLLESPAIAAAALAQPEQPQKERPDFLAGYSAGMVNGKRCVERDAFEALAQLEPVAWGVFNGAYRCSWHSSRDEAAAAAASLQKWRESHGSLVTYCVVPLYTSAPTQSAELVALNTQLLDMLKEARGIIDRLPGYLNGADFCDRIDAITTAKGGNAA